MHQFILLLTMFCGGALVGAILESNISLREFRLKEGERERRRKLVSRQVINQWKKEQMFSDN